MTLQALSAHLVGRGGAVPAGWSEVFEPLVGEYMATDWPDHDRHNREWSTAVAAGLADLLPEVMDRMQVLYRTDLPDPPVLVSTVYVGDRLPGYTSIRPTHVTCSTSHSESRGWSAVEIVLHETSHAMVHLLRDSIRDRIDIRQGALGQLWHVSLFFITGQVVARLLADRGVAYTPYLESTGLFDRAWPQFRQPITDAWTGYLDGQWDWDAACDRLADAVIPS